MVFLCRLQIIPLYTKINLAGGNLGPKTAFLQNFHSVTPPKDIFSISRKILFDMGLIEEPIWGTFAKETISVNTYKRAEMVSEKIKLVF